MGGLPLTSIGVLFKRMAWNSKIRLLRRLSQENHYQTFFLGHPVFVLVYLCLHLVVYLYLWQIFCIRLFVFLCFFVFERQLAVGNSRQPGCGQKRMPQMSLRKKKKWSIDNRVITSACVPIVPTVPIWKIWLALVAQIGIWIYQCRRMWKWSFWFHIISSEVDVLAVAIDQWWFPTRKL